jgi:hypothetical protein
MTTLLHLVSVPSRLANKNAVHRKALVTSSESCSQIATTTGARTNLACVELELILI